MRLRDGSVFPADYAPREAGVDDLGRRKYVTPEGEDGVWQSKPGQARRTQVLEHDPAYRVMQRAVSLYDLQRAEDRREFLAVLVAASFVDAWGYVQEISSRTSAQLLALDRLAEADEFAAAIESLRRRVERLAALMGDEVSAALDAREGGSDAVVEEEG